MSTAAVFMMIIALLAVWGGLGLALLNLKRHPEALDEEPDAAPRTDAAAPPHDGASDTGTGTVSGPAKPPLG